MRGRRKKRRKWERARKICSGGSVLAGGNYKNRYEWRGEEWRESGRKGERESEQGCVSVCMVLSPAEADVLYLPGNRRQFLQKPLFHRWNPRLYLQDSYCQFGLFEIEPETEILHTYVHTRARIHISYKACQWKGHSSTWQTLCPLWLYLHTIPAGGSSWKWRGILCDTRVEICHFKVWVKRPLRLLIGLSSSITPVLCIAPFVRAATATNTLKSSSFDPP